LFIECSAKDKTGVKQAFDEATQKILETPELWQSGGGGSRVNLDGGDGNDDDGQCGAC